MKIAIMTLPLGLNYGGMMQAWALQKVLKEAGHRPVTIDRRPDRGHDRGVFHKTARLGYRAFQKVLGRRKGPIRPERELANMLEHSHSFMAQHLNLSEPLNSTERLREHFQNERYDAVIVGSDQTWRIDYSSNIGNFFLDFLQDCKIRRIAYAASFGVSNWCYNAEQTQLVSSLARQFDAISVREKSGVALCADHLDVRATRVLDPTLLIDPRAYQDLCTVSEESASQPVFAYMLDQSAWKNGVVEAARQKLELPQIGNQVATYPLSSAKAALGNFVLPPIEDWIRQFIEAEFVVTDSFHGTIFSIMFRKRFVSLANPSRGLARFTSILEDIDLLDRLVTENDSKSATTVLEREINYSRVSEKLQQLRAESFAFLTQALS